MKTCYINKEMNMGTQDETKLLERSAAARGADRRPPAKQMPRRAPGHDRANPAAEPSGFASELRKLLASLARW